MRCRPTWLLIGLAVLVVAPAAAQTTTVTFDNCSWVQGQAMNCPNVQPYGGWTTQDGKRDEIVTVNGDGVYRHYRGVGTNNNGGSILLTVPTSTEVTVEYRLRNGGGLAYQNGAPHYQKDIYWMSGYLVGFGDAQFYVNLSYVGAPAAQYPNFYSSRSFASIAVTEWQCYAVYMNKATGALRLYLNGAQVLNATANLGTASFGDIRLLENQNTVTSPGHSEITWLRHTVGAGPVDCGGGSTPAPVPTPTPQPSPRPGAVVLDAAGATSTSLTFTWPQVDNGLGQPANYTLRWGCPTVTWWLAGGSERVITGTAVGAPASYTLDGLGFSTSCQAQVAAFRGPLGAATFGEISGPASGRTLDPPVPQTSPISFAPRVTVTKCRITQDAIPTATPPDATGGWRLEVLRGTTRIGSLDGTAPYGPWTSGEVAAGSYPATLRWVKTGQLPVPVGSATVVCGG